MLTKKQQEKERKIFTLAHNTHEKGLSSYAYYKLNDYSKSEDLVQDTFLKTWKYIIKGGKVETMKAFLYHILNDLIVDEYRKNNKTISLDTLLTKGFELSIDDSDVLIDNLDSKKSFLLIKYLPKKYKEVIYRKYIQDLSIKEISTLTKESPNTVAVQIHRALKKLKVLYKSK